MLIAIMTGCSRGAGPEPAPPPREAERAPAPPPREAEPAPAPPRVTAPPTLPDPGVRSLAGDLEVQPIAGTRAVSWSPSGRRAVMLAKPGAYLLETAAPSLTRLDFAPREAPVFWSESELLWEQAGRLQVRDLTTSADRLLHDFGAPVIHFLRPGDTHYVVNREKGLVQQGYRFGTIVAGQLGGQDETVLIDMGHLIGRMAAGEVLAVEGYRGGPLWALTDKGEKRLLSQENAYFVQLSPDGRQALWLTRSPEKSSWLELLKPAVAHADPPYDPPLTDLWTWDGSGDPVRIPLGGPHSARANFSPDGRLIALALNGVLTDAQPVVDQPGSVAVVTGTEIQTLATFDGRVGLGIWLGSDGFRYSPPIREKTGAQAPITRMSLTGETEYSHGIWYEAGTRDGRSLILNWMGDLTTVRWSDSAREARIDFDPNDHVGHPLYVPPSAPYLPFVSGDRVTFKRLVD